MLFENKPFKNTKLNINIDGSTVNQTDCVKFLGLQIDPQLTWKKHIDFLCNKIAKIIGVLYRVKFYLPRSILLLLYNSLIFSTLSYCNIVWGNTFTTYLNRLYILQKKAIRLITSTGYSSNVNKLFNKLNILTVFDIYRHQLGIFMFKINNNMLPAKFCNLFILNSSIHSYSTRNSSNYHLHNINTTIAKKSFIFSGIQFLE